MKTKDMQASRDKTRAAVAHLFCWCLIVALHQEEGIGRSRLDKLAAFVAKREREIGKVIREKGKKCAAGYARKKLSEAAPGAETDARVPLNRGVRNHREEQLLMAGNEAISLTWLIWALGLHDGMGFGAARLNRVRQATLDNYRQFNQWHAEDGEDVAFERLRRCVQDALKEEVTLQEEQEPKRPLGMAYNGQTASEEVTAVVCELARRQYAAAGKRPAPVALLSRQEMERRIKAAAAK